MVRSTHRRNRKTHTKSKSKSKSNYRSKSKSKAKNQRGGMGPFNYDNALLLGGMSRGQAEVMGLDRYIADSQVLARQAGGSRKRVRRSMNKNKTKSRKQRGGNQMAPFNGDYMLLPRGVALGVNPQFANEVGANPLYGEFKGAQA